MAVNIFNSLQFGNVDSSDYGIFISGEGVFNAPQRAVEVVTVPGRNGAVVIDQGRYENISVEYPAGVFGDDQTEFRTKLSQFRNALKAQLGYQRLTDTYHPDEYRMGVFVDAIEVDPVRYNTAGEFKLIFNCKPQRFLTSGEDPVSVASGDSIVNPTLFDSQPLIEFEGYGRIEINGNTIVVHNEPYGLVPLHSRSSTMSASVSLNSANLALMNTGDRIDVSSGNGFSFQVNDVGSNVTLTNVTATLSGDISGIATPGETFFNIVSVDLDGFSLTNETTVTKTISVDITINYNVNGASRTASTTLTFAYKYDGTAQTVSMYHVSTSPALPAELRIALPTYWDYAPITGDSTKLLVGEPIYIDLELGMAYYNGASGITSVNNIVELPADLPTLKAGANDIEYSNTFSSFEITPRWWQI
jgi:phage-related protein